MKEATQNLRTSVLEHIELISSPTALKGYPCPDEWICTFADDLYHPKAELFLNAFSEDELRDLAQYFGRLMIGYEKISELDTLDIDTILKIPEWRSLMSFAKDLHARLEKNV